MQSLGIFFYHMFSLKSLSIFFFLQLGKMRLTVPCRAVTCSHLQCFDAALYLQMNEKKPTWICPVCDKKAAYESLIIDGLVEQHYFCIYLYLFLILITWFPKMLQKIFVKYFVFLFFSLPYSLLF